MQQYHVENMETWIRWKKRIINARFRLWQTQYSWDLPDGFIVGFMNDDDRIEIVTHSKEIQDDIINSGL